MNPVLRVRVSVSGCVDLRVSAVRIPVPRAPRPRSRSGLAAENGDRVRYVCERLRANRVENWAAAWRALTTLDVQDQLSEIGVSPSIIAGAHDTSSTAEGLRRIAQALPHARFHVIAEDHMLALEQPAQLATLQTAVGSAGDQA